MSEYFDAGVFIAPLWPNHVAQEKCKTLIEAVLKGKKKALTNVINLEEAVHKLLRIKIRHEDLNTFINSLILCTEFKIVSLTPKLLIETLNNCAEYDLDAFDSIVLTTALKFKITKIWTVDIKFRDTIVELAQQFPELSSLEVVFPVPEKKLRGIHNKELERKLQSNLRNSVLNKLYMERKKIGRQEIEEIIDTLHIKLDELIKEV